MNYSEDLRRVAKRVVWFKTPEETLQEPKLFLAHLMTYGTLEDIATAMKYYSDADFDLMRRVHDAFNPDSALNPGKIFPLSKGCGEIRVRQKSLHSTSPL